MSAAAEQIRRTFTRAGAVGRAHIVDLADETRAVSVDPDTQVTMASVFKLAVLAELHRAADAGNVDLRRRLTIRGDGRGLTGISQMRDPVEMSLADLAQAMMTISDCAAADALFDLLGDEAINANLRRLGLQRTAVHGCCRDVFDAFSPDDLVPTTPREMTGLLAAIWSDTAAGAAACAEMRRVMRLQVWPHRLASGFPDDTVRVAGKTGTLPRIRNEVGVVEYADGGRYAAAIFTTTDSTASTLPHVDAAIGAAARIGVDALRRAHA